MPGDLLPTELPTEPIPGYRLVRQLGKGAFGEVWEAVGPGGFPVALKLVPLGGKVGESELLALEVIKGIRHAHLLATFGAWHFAGRLIIAMELADRTLFDRLHECIAAGRTGIPGPELLEYMREAAKGLDFLYQMDLRFAGGTDRIESVLCAAVKHLGKENPEFRVKSTLPSCVVFEVASGWFSREMVTLQAHASSIRVHSQCMSALRLDWARNRQNLELVQSALLRASSGVA